MQDFSCVQDGGKFTVTAAERQFILLGTAHVSQKSSEEVEELINSELPDAVCVELDQQRYQALTDSDRWKNLDLIRIVKEKKAGMLFVNLLLSAFQRRIGESVGVKPGSEMLVAIETAKRFGIPVVLADRAIGLTMRRAWGRCSWWRRIKLLSMLLMSFFSKEKTSEAEIESLKSEDMLHKLTDEMAKELPEVKKVLIDERDQFLAQSIFDSNGAKIVAVLGAGHVQGIVACLEEFHRKHLGGEDYHCPELLLEPKKTIVARLLPWLVTCAIIALIALGFFWGDYATGLANITIWFSLNFGFTFLLTLFSLPHPLTLFAASIAAPFTSLNPAMGAGIVAALVQLLLRKPCVADLERLHEDLSTVKGWYGNHVLRGLLVLFSSTLGSAVGTYLAVYLVANNVFS